ncbi:hypothetical protein FNV43_RR04552 [Rhamnella rubrinervis]|uniref:Uncharacterized protein n=1 Tax=Rhamnella rubrinervis TaxID=2594499 RepID=A0A8K0HKG8_9ROSA|nr:hypothetical protein FNV43_RR04552 [Rhamnella rubrinervis]
MDALRGLFDLRCIRTSGQFYTYMDNLVHCDIPCIGFSRKWLFISDDYRESLWQAPSIRHLLMMEGSSFDPTVDPSVVDIIKNIFVGKRLASGPASGRMLPNHKRVTRSQANHDLMKHFYAKRSQGPLLRAIPEGLGSPISIANFDFGPQFKAQVDKDGIEKTSLGTLNASLHENTTLKKSYLVLEEKYIALELSFHIEKNERTTVGARVEVVEHGLSQANELVQAKASRQDEPWVGNPLVNEPIVDPSKMGPSINVQEEGEISTKVGAHQLCLLKSKILKAPLQSQLTHLHNDGGERNTFQSMLGPPWLPIEEVRLVNLPLQILVHKGNLSLAKRPASCSKSRIDLVLDAALRRAMSVYNAPRKCYPQRNYKGKCFQLSM